ncbi:MAG: phosphate--AMP phosphotransferase [Lentisphaerota bacterium]
MNSLESIPASPKMEKKEYQNTMAKLENKIGELQRKIVNSKIPVIIVFEGWGAAGKGTLINKLMMSFDPRGYNVYPIKNQSEEEQMRPFLWRFWTKTPEKGRIAIFDRSWYRRLSVERVDRETCKKDWKRAHHEINSFEKQLVDDGCLIIKFFLHISKKEQKIRFKELLSNPATKWRVTKDDLRHHRQYGKYFRVFNEMIEGTDTDYAPWTLLESKDHKAAALKIFKEITDRLSKKLAVPAPLSPSRQVSGKPAPSVKSTIGESDLSLSMSRNEYIESLGKYQERMRDLEHEIYRKRMPVLILYEGWDAAGKGGNIRRVAQSLDPRGYEVVPVAAPSDIEKRHHYLWRFWNRIPKAGHIAIFDRTWYGRVLVERVEGFCSPAEWNRAYDEINEMEKQFSDSGAVIVKFWLNIDKGEQLRRFNERRKNVWKQWKITDEDWRNREKWDLYLGAVDEMLLKTNTLHSPWTVVESNCKLYARIKTLKTVIESVEKAL